MGEVRTAKSLMALAIFLFASSFVFAGGGQEEVAGNQTQQIKMGDDLQNILSQFSSDLLPAQADLVFQYFYFPQIIFAWVYPQRDASSEVSDLRIIEDVLKQEFITLTRDGQQFYGNYRIFKIHKNGDITPLGGVPYGQLFALVFIDENTRSKPFSISIFGSQSNTIALNLKNIPDGPVFNMLDDEDARYFFEEWATSDDTQNFVLRRAYLVDGGENGEFFSELEELPVYYRRFQSFIQFEIVEWPADDPLIIIDD
jgi:hypothetical protein